MANRAVGLYLYFNDGVHGWRYCYPVVAKGKIKPHFLIDFTGKERYRPEANYYLHYRQEGKKKWERLSPDANAAVKALERKRGELTVLATGGAVVKDGPPHTLLTTEIEKWLDLVKERLSMDSHAVKKLVMEEFIGSCDRKLRYVEDITRLDCLRYLNSFLKAQGNSDRTRWNKYSHLRGFLKDNNHDVFKKGDAPKYAEPDVEVYSDEEITKFFGACEPDEHLIFSVYFSAGLRLQEMESLRWADVNLKERFISIVPRPEFNFTPKKWHCRKIPLSLELTDRLAKHKGEGVLVFPTSMGGVDYHHLDACKRIAKRAGIDPDICYLHKFRASFCTQLLRANWDLGSVMKVMGHKNLESTARYVASLKQAGLRDRMDLTKAFNFKVGA